MKTPVSLIILSCVLLSFTSLAAETEPGSSANENRLHKKSLVPEYKPLPNLKKPQKLVPIKPGGPFYKGAFNAEFNLRALRDNIAYEKPSPFKKTKK